MSPGPRSTDAESDSNTNPDNSSQPSNSPGLEGGRAGRLSVARSAGIISLAVMASRILGLVREVIFTSLFGASRTFVADAFVIAFRIPNLLRDLFAEGALSSAFVTVFSDYLVKKDEKDARRLANMVTTALIVVLGAIVLIGIVFAPFFVSIFAYGYRNDPEKFELTIRLTRIMMPFILLVALGAQAMGLLNAKGRFGVPALASAFFNVGSIGGGVLMAVLLTDPSFSNPIGAIRRDPVAGAVGWSYGVLIGGLLQYTMQWPSLRRAGVRYRPLLSFSDPGVKRIFSLLGPAVLGAAAVQVNVMVNSNFASSIPGDGPVAWLNCAFRLMQFPIGVFGVAIATATLPSISRSASREELGEFRRTLAHSIRLAFLLTIPSAVGLVTLSRPIIALIYERGEFTSLDTERTAAVLGFYAIGLSGYAAIKILAPAFYALGDSRTPMKISLLSIVTNLALNWMLVSVLRERGLALSTSIVALLNFGLLYMLLRRRVGGLEDGRVMNTVLKVLVASGVMALGCWWLQGLTVGLAESVFGRALVLGGTVAGGAGIFYAVCTLLGVSDLKSITEAVATRLGPGRGR